ncbi:AzlC family ABC transporter permease [Christensenellaceae bacterium NSJ-53]|uniref:AzlC family ABC transporter permease n=2 Tax=Gehongia tenuis TaxID=2763655 RepID=A0A926D4K6_9FIRM|nr:AzlC family ABC transporter permease [Gehongia tenuis]
MGYVSVAFAFGMLAVQKGLPVWSPILISITNFTGTGQFAGIDLIAAAASFAEVAFTLLIINLRYLLMSLSLSQKLDSRIGIGKRLAIAFGVTDEIYAVSMQENRVLDAKYMAGLILCSYMGWVGGTVLGGMASTLMPPSIQSALGIALYAMFIAIIVPPMRTSKPITIVVVMALVMSCMFHYIPGLSSLSSGWVIIICGVTASAVGAYFFPVFNGDGEQEEDKP